MRKQLPRLVSAAILGSLVVVLTSGVIPAQQPLPQLPPPAAQPGDPDTPDAVEVLARGPVHEAFATTAEAPAAAPIVTKQPPEPIEELPPDQKPEGENVQWIPGYWHWDDDAEQFIWISGFWRAVPPGRLWVPGSWRVARGGWQWVAGFWQEPDPQQPMQPQIDYLPQPPDSVEVGPSVAAPTATSFYVPGCWVWRGRFVWRPGFWIEYRPNWVWVPARWCWTPAGYVFVDGYWDYPLASRGVLYAPVAFTRPVYVQPAFVYTPAYVVSEPCMVGALFVRRGWGCYFFGDYFAPRYTTLGFNAWCGTVGPRGGFSIGFGVGRSWGYDPLWSYYSVAYRNTPGWSVAVAGLYGGRFAGTIARPPVTLVQQNTIINNITNVNVTNVTNNVTVVNKNIRVNNTNVTDVAMLAPARVVKDLQPEARVQPISAQVRNEQARTARQIREVAAQRQKLETEVAAKPTPKDAPRTVKLEVPKDAVARAQVKDEKKAPPPNPNRDLKAATKVDPKADQKLDPHPIFTPKVDPKGKVDPKIDPKGKTDPKVDPKGKADPKVDPKGKGDPKMEPKIDPKGKVDPKMNPKVDPKGKGDPKVDPKVDPKGKGDSKVDPKGLSKVDPKGSVDLKLPSVNVDPKGLPPVVNPKLPPPKVDPKSNDPRSPLIKPLNLPPPKPSPKNDPPPKVELKKDPPPVVHPPPTAQRQAPMNVNPGVSTRSRIDPPANPQPARLVGVNQPVNLRPPATPERQRPPTVQMVGPQAQSRLAGKASEPVNSPQQQPPERKPKRDKN